MAPFTTHRCVNSSLSLYQMNIFKIGLRYFQIISLISYFPLHWPDALKTLFAGFTAASSVGDGVISVECPVNLFPFGAFFGKAALYSVLPLVLLAVVALMFRVSSRLAETEERKNLWISKFVAATVALGLVCYPTLTQTTTAFFRCAEFGKDRTFLRADMSQQCWTHAHWLFTAVIAVPAFALYTIGFPLGTLYMLVKGTERLGLNARTFDYVMEGYTQESRFFEPVIILRLGFLGISSVLFQSMVEVQIYAGLMILFVALVINLRVKPFSTRGLNTIEEVTLIASWFTLFGGALLFSPKITLDWFKIFVTVMIFVTNLGVFFFLIYSALSFVQLGWR